MLKVGLLVRIEALPGKEDDVERFLEGGLDLVNQEPGTVTWYAIRFGPSSFGIFDTFADNTGRDAHLNGAVAAALGENAGRLFSTPVIEKVDLLATKLPS
jgi:quinol monooxygenase YgiN